MPKSVFTLSATLSIYNSFSLSKYSVANESPVRLWVEPVKLILVQISGLYIKKSQTHSDAEPVESLVVLKKH